MSFELVYTSAQRGLKPNSSGFCTVAATGGISKLASMKLEGLSAYEFHFKLSDANANLNPANFAHTVVKVGGKRQSVLSRVGFAGPDYSGRANKIAHHFLLGDQERLDAGPGEMLAQLADGEFRQQWQGEPSDLQPRSLAESLNNTQPSGPAGHWQSVAGDAGWAGMLAKAFKEGGRVPAYVIFAPGTDILELFAESLAVLPPQQRWEVNFATYYTSMPAGCYYNWRGILAGSRTAQEIAKFPNATVIDLTNPLGQAPDNEYTNAARSGQALAAAAAAGVSAGLRNVEPDEDEIDDLDDIYQLAQEEEPTKPAKRRRKVAAPIDMLAAGAAQANATPSSRSNKGLKITIAVLSLLVAALLITFVLTISFFKGTPDPTVIADGGGAKGANTEGRTRTATTTTAPQPTTAEDEAKQKELTRRLAPIANALDKQDTDAADKLLANLPKDFVDHPDTKHLGVRRDKIVKEQEDARKKKFEQHKTEVDKAFAAELDEKSLKTAEESLEKAAAIAKSPGENSWVKNCRKKIREYRACQTKMEKLEKDVAAIKAPSNPDEVAGVQKKVVAYRAKADEIEKLPGFDKADGARLAAIRKRLTGVANARQTYGILHIAAKTPDGRYLFKGESKGSIYGKGPSDSKEFKFTSAERVGEIRFLRNKLDKAKESVKPRLKQNGSSVRLIITKPMKPPKPPKTIEIAEYYVTDSKVLNVRLLEAAKKDKDLENIAKAVVVEVLSSGKKAGIYQCRIRQDKKVPLPLGFTAAGKTCNSEYPVVYPWTNMLKLKLPGKVVPLSDKKELPMIPNGSLTLSWTLDKEKGKVTFSIKTNVLEKWRADSKRLATTRDRAQKTVNDYQKDKDKSRRKAKTKAQRTLSEQNKSKPPDKRVTLKDTKWEEAWRVKWEKYHQSLQNKVNEPKQKLGELVARINQFADACEKLPEIEVLDPWDVLLERLKVKFPIPSDRTKIREFVDGLGKPKPK